MNSTRTLNRFFLEIYHVLKNANRNTIEVWQQINEIPVLSQISNQIELDDFLNNFNFIKLKDGNYIKNHYISINKIQYICESMKYLDFDIKNLSLLLDYNGFEALAEEILLRHGFQALKNFRFKDNSTFKSQTKQKRYEIDVIGFYNKFLLIIDCKQWKKRDSFSVINKAANLQLKRALALKKNPQVLSDLIQTLIGLNHKIKLPLIMIPMMITLEENSIKMNDNQVPLVSIYNLKAFLHELPYYGEYYKTIELKSLYIQKQLF